MKKIFFNLFLFVSIQNAFAGIHDYFYFVNHTRNTAYNPSNGHAYADIGDSVSIYLYNTFDQGPVPVGEWFFTLCTTWANCTTPIDTIPGAYGQNPLNVVITQHGSYRVFSESVMQVIIDSLPSLPAMPGIITGRKKGVCNLSNVTYSVPPVAGVPFIWTVPAGATIVSGQYYPSIVVNYPNASISGQVTVKGNSFAGTGPQRSINVTSNPAVPAPVTGPVSVCSGSTGNVYSIPPVFSAVSYQWRGPAGSHISDGTTTSTNNILTTASTSVTVSFGTVTPTSVLKVKTNNNCGSSLFRKLTLVPCGPRNASEETETASLHIINSVNIYPTAVNSPVTIEFNSAAQNDIEISFFDITGKQLKSDFYKNISGEFIKNENTEALAKGIYFVRIKAGDEVIQRKFIKM